ncbi:MAG: hypothetical protein OXG56_12955 [Gammaproteobacteria bacterium]|nr:hypothetical protein [Gammaproteobacteria bacterium]
MGSQKTKRWEVVHPDCTGVDAGKRRHYVSVDASRFEQSMRHFGACTTVLQAMAESLSSCGVRGAPGESAGDQTGERPINPGHPVR